MAFGNRGTGVPGIVAGADLSSAQFRAVVLDSNGDAVLAGADVAITGILQNKPTQGVAATIWGAGSTSKVLVGTGGATAGALATTTADGVADAAATDIVCGRFQEGGAAGAIVTMVLDAGTGGAAP